MVFDMRFIPNPYYLKSMRKLTGNSEKVSNYVLKFPETQEFLQTVHDLIEKLIPYYIREENFISSLESGAPATASVVAVANCYPGSFSIWETLITVHRDL